MASTIKQLREERAKLVADARKILDKADSEKRRLTAEEQGQYISLMGGQASDGIVIKGKEQELKDQINLLECQERVEAELASVDKSKPIPGRHDFNGHHGGDMFVDEPTEEQRAIAIQAWCRYQLGMNLNPRHEEACRLTGIAPHKPDLDLDLTKDYRAARKLAYESRALSITSGPAGGYTVPQGFVNNLEIALLAYGGMRQVADVMRTDSGNDLPWPTVNDAANKGAIVAENASVSQQDVTFSQILFRAYKYTSKLILVPVELLEDSAFDLASYLGEALATRIARIQNDHFTTGTGAAQPQGIITAAVAGKTAASATAIAADELYDLKHSVDPSYRVGATWMMHDNILLVIKKLKDGLGRYLWQAGLAHGAPDMLDGDPIVINQSMANVVATGNKTILYGQLKKYKIRDVSQIRIRRLVERFADNDQEGFMMFMRSDGNLLDAGTRPAKFLVQA